MQKESPRGTLNDNKKHRLKLHDQSVKNDEKSYFLIIFKVPRGASGRLQDSSGRLQETPGGSGRLQKGSILKI